MSTVLPQNILKLMSPADRAKLGPAGKTAEELLEACEVNTERQLQQILYQWLTVHRGVGHVICSRMDRKTTYAVGTPDLLFVYKGVPFAFEAKSPGGSLRPEQTRVGISMLKDGWHWHIIRSFAEAKAILDNL